MIGNLKLSPQWGCRALDATLVCAAACRQASAGLLREEHRVRRRGKRAVCTSAARLSLHALQGSDHHKVPSLGSQLDWHLL